MNSHTFCHACPWWFCFTFDNFIRDWYQKPRKFLAPFVQQGFHVLDVGPGRGYCTFPIASMIERQGVVYALDIQKPMLEILKKRAEKKGFTNVITHLYDGEHFNIQDQFDFVNIFWMFHEVRNKDVFLKELKAVCKPKCKILFCEPYIHVSKKNFNTSLQHFQNNGFQIVETLSIKMSRAVALENGATT